MILTGKHLIKRALLNQNIPFKIHDFSQNSINKFLPYSSILIAKNRSYFSTNKSIDNLQEGQADSESKSFKKKTQQTSRRRQLEKEQSDNSDYEDNEVIKSKLQQNLKNDYEENQQDNNPDSLKNTNDQSTFQQNEFKENFEQFDASQDENFQNTQVLIDRIMKGEVEFNDGDPIDKLVSLDDVFKSRERRLSFQLMNLEDPLTILQFYDQEVQRITNKNGEEEPLIMDEVGLFFHFATFQKKFISDNPIFQKILLKIIENSRDLSVHSLQSFIWSFGSYVYEFGEINLTEKMKKNLSDSILQNCKNFEFSQNPQLCFAISQIFSDINDNQFSEPIVEKLANKSAEYIETLTHDELVTFIMTFMTVNFSNTSIISKFVERLVEVKEVMNIQNQQCQILYFEKSTLLLNTNRRIAKDTKFLKLKKFIKYFMNYYRITKQKESHSLEKIYLIIKIILVSQSRQKNLIIFKIFQNIQITSLSFIKQHQNEIQPIDNFIIIHQQFSINGMFPTSHIGQEFKKEYGREVQNQYISKFTSKCRKHFSLIQDNT